MVHGPGPGGLDGGHGPHRDQRVSRAGRAAAGAGHFSPGGLAHLMGVSAAHTRGLSYQAQSTNWSGYAATTGTYTSVSASWTQPAGT